MKQGTLRYANIHAEGRFSLSRQAGVSPGQITANFLMSASLPPYGDVFLEWDGKTITLPNCRLRRKVVATSGAGRVQQVLLEDRRWRWQFDVVGGPLYGYYNHYEKGIKVTTATNIKSCRALAIMILQWMGEVRFDVSALPDDFFPLVMWDGEDPAAALEALVDTVGCQVVLRWDNTVRIVQRGIGQNAPSDSRVMDYTISQEPSVIPEFIIVEAGTTRFQADLPLEAIGYDPDTKEIRLVDDLSYKPATGWGSEAPGQFYGITDPLLRDLAQSCVWKMFRPAPPFDLAVNGNLFWRKGITSRIATDQLWRILPLESQQLDLWRDRTTDRLKDAQIIGWFCDQHHGWKNNMPFPFANVAPGTPLAIDQFRSIDLRTKTDKGYIYRGFGRAGEMPFSIDAELGIIRTYEPLFCMALDVDGNSTEVIAPPVSLRTSFIVRDPDWRSPYRQQYIVHVPGGKPGLVKTLRIADLLYEFSQASPEIPVYFGPADFPQQCYFYALRWLNQFYDGPSAVIPMKGLALDIDVDGAMRSVTLSRDEGGRSTTVLEWHTERPEVRPTYTELFDKRTINQVVKRFRQVNSAAARSNGKRDFGGGFKDQGGGGFGS